METSAFNPETFLETELTDANSTERIPIPVGEYPAVADKVEARQWVSEAKGTSGIALDITWSIDDEAVREIIGRDVVTCRQSIMLDMLDSGGLDMGKGKNIGLGRLRDALNLNTPGKPFSFSMLVGRVGLVKVDHRTYEGNIYDEIKSVAKY